MRTRNVGGLAGLLAAACLVAPAAAGPYVNLMQPCDCPPTHYSAFHVLTPIAYRWAAWCQGPNRYIFAKITNPDIPPTPYVTRYHCPSVNPLQFSVVNYPGLNGNIPGSSYQSPQQQQASAPPEPQQTPPQELPPPRIEQGGAKGKGPELLPPPPEVPENKKE